MAKLTAGKLRLLSNDFKKEGIVTDGSVLRCNFCDTEISVDLNHQISRIRQHVVNVKHVSNKRIKGGSSSKQLFIGNAIEIQAMQHGVANEFNTELASAFLQSGVPLYKVNHPAMQRFLEKWTKNHVPDQSTLRKNYVRPLYTEVIAKIRLVIGNNPVYFIMDETTDAKKRFVLNFLVAPLTGKPVKPMLLKMYNLTSTNRTTVMQAFNDTCSYLWTGNIRYDRVWLVLTDQASYMLSACSALKTLYNNLRHVTCIVHALHRVCESVRMEYTKANAFVAEMKKVLLKSPYRTQLYKETTNLPLPPQAIVTRWGTWISSAAFYAENFDKISKFLEELGASDAGHTSEAVAIAKHLSINKDVKVELLAVHKFQFIIKYIKMLQENGLPKATQWDILQSIRTSLDGFSKEKLENSLLKNPDIVEVADPQFYGSDLEFSTRTQFAPLVSVDVERSFSEYKATLVPNRESFTFENIEMVMIVKSNSFLFANVDDL